MHRGVLSMAIQQQQNTGSLPHKTLAPYICSAKRIVKNILMEKTAAAPWSFSQKLVFRFFLIFFLIYIFFNPNGVLPYSDYAFSYYIQPFHKLMAWIGKNYFAHFLSYYSFY